MLRRAKSFMVKNHVPEPADEPPELSETAHLRRKFVPIATQPIYECIPQHRNKPQQEQETTKPQVQQNTTTRRSFRGLRRQISISVDNMMKNGLFSLRATKKQDNGGVEAKQDGVCARRSFIRSTEVGEKPVIEVQHNNASRLRMSQVKKPTK